jgi:hypothetical protein
MGLPPLATSQTVMTTGSLHGRVTDPSGSVILTTRIELTEEATGASSADVTNHDGEFMFPALKVGSYSRKATAPGFRTSRIRELSIQVGQASTAQIRLELGAASETVDVTATTPLPRTTKSTLSTVVSRSLLDGLPRSAAAATPISRC